MKLIVVPPYRASNFTPGEGHYMVRELIAELKEKGRLDGVEIDVDDGFPVEDTTGYRDEELLATIAAGSLKRMRMYCEGDRYDAIILSGGIEPGFTAGRTFSKIPIAGVVHAGLHMASLIGQRISYIHLNDPTALIVRSLAERYGLSHKVVSVRSIGISSPAMMGVVKKFKRGERGRAAEGKKLIDDMVALCIAAVEEDMSDTLIFGCPHPQCLQDEILQRLAEAGYGEIQIVGGFSAAVAMARAMVDTGLKQAARAYPTDVLKAKPRFR